jgi:ubiquinone/menaquinone biosynthesis C-methylase UbiE
MTKQKGQMGEYARFYDLIMFVLTLGREKDLRRKEIRLAQLKPGDKVLEIGCGTGTLSLAAKTQVGSSGEVFGIDIAPEMIAVASRKATRKGVNVTFQVGSIASIPFQNNQFDTVMCSFMIFHMPEDIRLQGFKEIYRVLKSGGQLFILDVASKDKRYDIRELAPVLRANSYSDIEIEGIKFAPLKGWVLRAKARKL